MSKPDAPAAPDYKGAAEATAAGNRVNQYTPFGSLTYSQSGTDSQGNPTYSQTMQLAPEQQQLLDQQNQTSMALAGLQGKGVDAVSNLFGNLPSASQLTPRPINPGETAQSAIMRRLQPQIQQQNNQFEQQMANQGIAPGTEAYDNARRSISQQQNDMMSQAALQGIDVSQNARNAQMNEQGFYSQMPINLLNAIRTGSQVQTPQFGATPAGANYLGAAQNQYQAGLNAYNSQMGGANSMMSGLFGLGGTILGAPSGSFASQIPGMIAGFGSDRRFKTDIRPAGKSADGHNLYEFRYKTGAQRYIGVMADEVEHVPGAVHVDADGMKYVDYSKIG